MSEIVEGAYLHDLLEQPEALGRACQRLGAEPAVLEIAQGLANGGAFDRVVLTGMGSSLHALYPLHLTLLAHGFSSLHVETAELIHFQTGILTPRTLVIAVSQSGRSGETLALLEKLDAGTQVLAVTNDPASPLASRSRARLLLHAGPESTVSCKTYVSTLLVLDWLGAVLTGQERDAVRGELAVAGAAAGQYLRDWRRHVSEFSDLLDGVGQVYLAGRGPSLATAYTGGLILKESTRTACEGMSCAAFRHGPFEVLSPHVFVMVMAGDVRTAELNRRLVADIGAAGGRAICIDSVDTSAMAMIPAAPERIRPILEILPVQMLSLAIAAKKGEEAGRFRLASKITTSQ